MLIWIDDIKVYEWITISSVVYVTGYYNILQRLLPCPCFSPFHFFVQLFQIMKIYILIIHVGTFYILASITLKIMHVIVCFVFLFS